MQWYWNSFQKVLPPLMGTFSIFNEKSRKIGILAKIYIFGKVLFLLLLLRLGVPRYCFCKESNSQFSEKFTFLSDFEILEWPTLTFQKVWFFLKLSTNDIDFEREKILPPPRGMLQTSPWQSKYAKSWGITFLDKI